MNIQKILAHFNSNDVFSKQDFRKIVLLENPGYSDASITWLLKKLREESKITSVGCGKYMLMQTTNIRNDYFYMHSTQYNEIEHHISSEFPLVDFQMWELIQLNEFVNHQLSKNLFIVEVESMLVDSVFESLHQKFPYTLFCPTIEQYYRQKGIENDIVVLKLISEAPSSPHGHSCCIEKILVDLFSSKFTGKLIERNEYALILEESFRKYRIDENKLFRYAKRRNLEKTILKFIKYETMITLLTR